MDAKELKSRLCDQIEGVCAHLLPEGRRDGRFWAAGDVGGGPGKSLKINLDGPHVGCWKDFGTPASAVDSGDIISLWMEVRRVTFVDALEEIKKYLGVTDGSRLNRYRPPVAQERKPEYHGPKLTLHVNEAKEGGAVWKWLTEVRKLKPETIRRYKIGEDGRRVVFPFYDSEGHLVRLKMRPIDSKDFFQFPTQAEAHKYEHGAARTLWGWQGVGNNDDQACICEGELDAMTYWQETGVPALSLPEGCQLKKSADGSPMGELSKSHDAWIEHDTPALERFETIDLCTDMDECGRATTRLLAPRLGVHRIRVIEISEKKDANEVLMKGGSLGDRITARDLLPDNLKRPLEFEDAVWNEFFPEGGDDALGDRTPWTMPFRFRPGELTIWHGWNGSGKTICLTYVAVVLGTMERKSCIASMEMPARKTFRNAVRQAIGYGHPWGADDVQRRECLHSAMRWLDGHMMVYDKIGEVSVVDVIDAFEYCFRRYGTTHFVLDSLMMLKGQDVADQQLYANQTEVVKMLKAFAAKVGGHVHMVAHSKKPDSKTNPARNWPDKFDISGAGGLSNIADNVVCVWRNAGKENDIATANQLLALKATQEDPERRVKALAALSEAQQREDTLFIVQKQRETGEVPMKRLYFDFGVEGSWQFVEEACKDDLRRTFVPGIGASPSVRGATFEVSDADAS